MRPTRERGVCPLCGDPNAYTIAYCQRCNYRLPWADVVEGVDRSQFVKPLEETGLDRALKEFELLPERTLRCRYCEAAIDVDAKQCPHCKLWLVSAVAEADMDPWQHDYDERATKHVNMIGPRAGCFSVIALLSVAIIIGTLKIVIC
jgi:predicted amidophosphoribosyltransferase